MSWPDFVRETLEALRREGLYRRLRALGSATGPRVRLGGREVLQFASNNYLGLATDPRVGEALRRAVRRWGWGAGASRLLAGHTEAHAALEADLADFLGAEAALVFPSGYMANLGAVAALAGGGPAAGRRRADRAGGPLVVMDRACHASLYDAVALAGVRPRRYAQCDAQAAARALARALEEAAAAPAHRPAAGDDGAPPAPPAPARARGPALLLTDTVFSMDGRRAPLADLLRLAAEHGAVLVADEAHALGVLGETGAGLAEEIGLLAGPDRAGGAPEPGHGLPLVRIGTLSKALGGVGGFVAAPREVIDLVVNRARPFIYTTALPAAACEAAREALRILRAEPERRRRLHALARRLRRRLREEGFVEAADGTFHAPTRGNEAAGDERGRGAGEEAPEKEGHAAPSRAAAAAAPSGPPTPVPRAGVAPGTAAPAEDRPPTPIVAVVFGEPARALGAAEALLEQGIFCPAVRPPTVPPGTSRLRVSLTAEHTEEDLERLVEALVAARDEA